MLADPAEPYLLDVIVEAEENVYPMIPAGGSYRDIINEGSVGESGQAKRGPRRRRTQELVKVRRRAPGSTELPEVGRVGGER